MTASTSGGRSALLGLASALSLLALPSIAEAKRPGSRHCFHGVCHRVMTLQETEAQIGRMHRIKASHYDSCRHDRLNPCGLTSSGEVFRPGAPDNAASAIHPDGTILLVRNPDTGLAAVVRVNNFGPFHGDRKLDLSRATAERLGFARRGVASLEVVVAYAPTPAEARYSRKRRYDPVPGFIGRTESIETANARYAALSLPQRIARRDAAACRIAANSQAPRLQPITSLPASQLVRLASR